MYRNLLLWLCLLLAPLSTAMAEAKEPAVKKPAVKEPVAREPADKDKELSGMSIVGNDEAPKALYIVPWKSSEIGMETNLNMMLTDSAIPVDRDVFMRQLDFFEVSTRK
jgi:hypothetical protein